MLGLPRSCVFQTQAEPPATTRGWAWVPALLQTPPQLGAMVLRECKASKPVPLVGWGPAGASQAGHRGTKHTAPTTGDKPDHLKPLLSVSPIWA